MSQLLINKLKGVAGVLALVAMFFVASTVDAKAQGQSIRARNDGSNPYSLLAQKLGVTACAPGTASNVQSGLATLNAQATTLKQSLTDGTATLVEKVKYEYFTKVILEVGTYNVAPEVATLVQLSPAAKIAGNESITNQQLAAMYNSAKQAFGMCQ